MARQLRLSKAQNIRKIILKLALCANFKHTIFSNLYIDSEDWIFRSGKYNLIFTSGNIFKFILLWAKFLIFLLNFDEIDFSIFYRYSITNLIRQEHIIKVLLYSLYCFIFSVPNLLISFRCLICSSFPFFHIAVLFTRHLNQRPLGSTAADTRKYVSTAYEPNEHLVSESRFAITISRLLYLARFATIYCLKVI